MSRQQLKQTGTHPLREYSKYVSFNVLGMVGISCYILADTFFVARATGSQGLAALNLALPVYNLIHGTGLMLGMGGATWYSIRKGQQEEAEANRIFSSVVCFAAAISLLFILAGVLFSSEIAAMLGADASLLYLSGTYLRVLCCFAPFFLLNDVLICFIRNDEDPNLAMTAMVVGSLANVVLDYVFIFPLGMGLFGAALATGIAPFIGICLALIHWKRPSHTLKFVTDKNRFPAKQALASLRSVLALGVPSFITELSSGIVILVFNLLLLDLSGTTGVAAYGVVANISYVVIAIYTGIAQGVQPLMSRAFGEGDRTLVSRNLRYAIWTIGILSIIIYGIIFLFADGITQIFNSEGNAQLQQIAAPGLRLYFAAVFFAGTNIFLAVYFASINRALPAQSISLLRGVLLLVPMAFTLARLLGVAGVWISFPATEGVVLLIALIIYCAGRKKDVY